MPFVLFRAFVLARHAKCDYCGAGKILWTNTASSLHFMRNVFIAFEIKISQWLGIFLKGQCPD